MKLRLTDKVTVTFEQPNPLKDVLIAPMLFLPFVENTFKHGVSTQQPTHCYQATEFHIAFGVQNSKFNEKRLVLDESNGIGLTNTQRRLDLLYPNQYSLLINEHTADNEYLVQLTLNIS